MLAIESQVSPGLTRYVLQHPGSSLRKVSFYVHPFLSLAHIDELVWRLSPLGSRQLRAMMSSVDTEWASAIV